MKRASHVLLLAVFLFVALVGTALAGPMGQYALGCGDVLEISVWGDEALSRPNVVIRPDGKISFPLVGELQAAGRTMEELRNDFEDRLREYISDAPVTIMLQELISNTIYVVGKVNRPGAYPMAGQLTVLQALALAGGMTPFADDSDILVIRSMPDGSQEYLEFDYVDVSGGDNLDQNVSLLPGDTVLVP